MLSTTFGSIYNGKKVLVTGHTGFKGAWLTLWLSALGAKVFGYALEPPTRPALFDLLHMERMVSNSNADIRDFGLLKKAIQQIKPDIIFHLAAQSSVRESYSKPLETIQINTLGSVNVMEAVRQVGLPVAIVMITSDKCYENKEWQHGYRETDPLGGYDPYSSSKGAAELLINSWRNSFFNVDRIESHGVRIASARAGNVIGGGDFAEHRIVPDCIRDLQVMGEIGVRNPNATRPWQHVLEPLHGYLQLGAKLLGEENVATFCGPFNFGPLMSSNRTVEELVEKIIYYWGHGSWNLLSPKVPCHEASLLNLSIDNTYHILRWLPRWDFNTAVRHTVEWYKLWLHEPQDLLEFTLGQIQSYEEAHLDLELQTLMQKT